MGKEGLRKAEEFPKENYNVHTYILRYAIMYIRRRGESAPRQNARQHYVGKVSRNLPHVLSHTEQSIQYSIICETKILNEAMACLFSLSRDCTTCLLCCCTIPVTKALFSYLSKAHRPTI